jgi:biotin carboxylase
MNSSTQILLKNQKVLVSGGAVGDLSIVRALKKIGLTVFTSGNRPTDIAHKDADGYIPCDYTDHVGLTNICREYGINFLVPSAHDLAAVAAAKVAHTLGFPGFDTPELSEIIHSKDLLRKRYKVSGGRVPEFSIINSPNELLTLTSKISFPVIVKPVDLTGGTGISICNNFEDLRNAYYKALEVSHNKRIIVEQLLSGTYHGLSCLIEDGKIVFSFVDNEFYLYSKTRVSGTSFPTTVSQDSITALKSEIERFSQENFLVDGLLHIQFIETPSGPYLLEMCRRTPGDAYPIFVSNSVGFDYSTLIVRYFLGQSLGGVVPESHGSYHARFVLMPQLLGSFRGMEYPEIPQLESILDFRHIGELIASTENWTAGIFFFKSDNCAFDIEFFLECKSAIRAIVA